MSGGAALSTPREHLNNIQSCLMATGRAAATARTTILDADTARPLGSLLTGPAPMAPYLALNLRLPRGPDFEFTLAAMEMRNVTGKHSGLLSLLRCSVFTAQETTPTSTAIIVALYNHGRHRAIVLLCRGRYISIIISASALLCRGH